MSEPLAQAEIRLSPAEKRGGGQSMGGRRQDGGWVGGRFWPWWWWRGPLGRDWGQTGDSGILVARESDPGARPETCESARLCSGLVSESAGIRIGGPGGAGAGTRSSAEGEVQSATAARRGRRWPDVARRLNLAMAPKGACWQANNEIVSTRRGPVQKPRPCETIARATVESAATDRRAPTPPA